MAEPMEARGGNPPNQNPRTGRGPHNRRPLSPGGGGPTGPTGGTGHKGGDSSCSMWAPVAVALLPYALARLALDGWRSRRGRDAS